MYFTTSLHMVDRWSHMYYTSYSTFDRLHKSFQAITQSCRFLVHKYSNSYLPSFNTSYVDAHTPERHLQMTSMYTLLSLGQAGKDGKLKTL